MSSHADTQSVAGSRYWKKELVLVYNVLPAVISFFISLLAMKKLGVDDFGRWLLWRSGCQIAAAINPGFSIALVYWLPKINNFKIKKSIHKANVLRVAFWASLCWTVLTTLCFLMVIFIILGNCGLDFLALSLFWPALIWSGFLGCLARGNKDGISLMGGMIGYMLGAIISVFSLILFSSWSLFVLSNALGFWLQGLGQYLCLEERSFSLFITKPRQAYFWFRKLFKTALPWMIRGWAQTSAQYSDRLIVGVLFGNVAAGYVGLGSTLASPIMIMSSSIMAWALPLIIGNDSRKKVFENFKSYLWLLFFLGLAGEMLLPIFQLILLPSSYGSYNVISIIMLGFYISTLISFSNILILPYLGKGNMWIATIFQLMLIVVFGGGIFLTKMLSYNLQTGLIIVGISLTCLLMLFAESNNWKIKMAVIFSSLLVACYSVYFEKLTFSSLFPPYFVGLLGIIVVLFSMKLFFKMNENFPSVAQK